MSSRKSRRRKYNKLMADKCQLCLFKGTVHKHLPCRKCVLTKGRVHYVNKDWELDMAQFIKAQKGELYAGR